MSSAGERDAAADASDLAAVARDRAAEVRDREMDRTDVEVTRRDRARAVTAAEVVVRASGQRERAAGHRARSAEHRLLAAGDRDDAAEDRERSARERRRGHADRAVLACQLEIAETDPMAGARTRVAGLHDLDCEVARCRRATGMLVVAAVNVVGREAVPDSPGQGSDDGPQHVVSVIRAHLRSYDLVIRLGSDELLCAMSGVTLTSARERFSVIADTLAATQRGATITTGFAELTSSETATDLIARAVTS